ncbi:lytic transglycosylase domain-containing protein [Sphingomonas sp. RG327]|uniref:Lytic transglycosylase domain-containing protein n=1 Tax=Sphingomonas anseongensis TaxID=2908207 RepID=A0ABT0RCR7_9SPHN|nr:lytic transglycosylase domain-containing protein [Sphingomonas anseongensis]MCL6678059.1 lytic transglycosylase domain-containing protein [Sphingomonas anseongensis]
MSILSLALSAAVAASAQPVPAGDPLAPLPQVQVPPPAAQPAAQPQAQTQVPPPPPRAIVIPRDWREVFAAIRAGDWGSAQAGIAVLPDDVLAPVAKAELYTAKGSPPVDLPRIQSLLAQGPDLPDADQLARLAAARGSTTPMAIIPERPTVGLGAGPRRYRPKPVGAEPLADALRAQIDGFVKADDAPNAEAALIAQAPYLSADARTEAAQRIAWIYYTNGDDLNARRVADTWRASASGEWGSQAAWASGLASWRMGDCNAAARAFREVAATAPQRELSAGGYYWAARSEQACRRPQSVEPLLKAAAASPESFYGLVARETLGTSTRLPPPAPISTASVEALPNVRRAKALAAIGETALAEEMLRHQARIGAPADHAALLEMARRLNLAGAQYWLATNGQRGVRVQAAYRYPRPEWTPIRGWRVDPALAFAHIIQESNFRPGAVSSAGAVGLMQVLPSTAAAIADQDGLGYSRENLFSPTLNLEYGQSFIERMRRSANTGGQLPKVIASYNAGPLPVGRWAAIRDKGDPVLWIESIPYWETRYYVPAVMRNLWVYEGLEGDDQSSLKAIAQHRWPAFPARSGALQR